MKNTMIQKQRFGIEVEMIGLSRKKAADTLGKVFGTVSSAPDNTVYHT